MKHKVPASYFNRSLIILVTTVVVGIGLLLSTFNRQNVKVPSTNVVEQKGISTLIVLGNSISARHASDNYATQVRDYLNNKQGANVAFYNYAQGATSVLSLSSQLDSAINENTFNSGKTLLLVTSGGNDVLGYLRNRDSFTQENADTIEGYFISFIQHVIQVSANFPDGFSIYLMDQYDPTDGTGKGAGYMPNYSDPLTFTRLNNIYQNVARQFPNIVFVVPVYSDFLGHGNTANGLSNKWIEDTIHPNSSGYADIAKRFIEQIELNEFNGEYSPVIVEPTIAPIIQSAPPEQLTRELKTTTPSLRKTNSSYQLLLKFCPACQRFLLGGSTGFPKVPRNLEEP